MDAVIEDDYDRDEIELGERPAWWFLMWELASAYSTPQAREDAAIMTLVGSVATSTSHLGHEYPEHWWPRGEKYGQRPAEVRR